MDAWPAEPAVPGTEPAFEEIAAPLRPLVEVAWELVRRDIGECAELDIAGIGSGFTDQLTARLATLGARTLVSELHSLRNKGELRGSTPRHRFIDFVRQLSDRGKLSALFARYPVLARLLGQACAQAVGHQVELLRRFEQDRATIVSELLHGVDPGALVAVTTGVGDSHQGGRSVAVLRFAGGASIVYKPRCQRVQALFGELVGWLNTKLAGTLEIAVVATVPRDTYGWLEFIEHTLCDDVDQVDRFYRRQGALLALLYAVEATDVHYQNLVAHCDQPMLIDVETLFHPHLQPAMIADPDPAMAALDSSVYRTALLPQFQLGDHGVLDLSGMGGDPGAIVPSARIRWDSVGTDGMRLVRVPVPLEGAANRPGLDAEPAEYLAALLDGFRAGYNGILANRAELLGEQGLLHRFAGCTTRLLNQATELYATLLSESTHPDLLRDGLDRERVFDVLRQDTHTRVARALVEHEVVDLWNGDIPLFFVQPGSRDVWMSGGQTLPDLLDESGAGAAGRKIAAFSDLDRRHQEWLLTAALSVRTEAAARHASGAVSSDPSLAMTPDPQRLLLEACGIADEIISMAVHDGRRANWVGLELIDGRTWAVQPLGAGLANGYTGVALFLAQLGKLTGATRYTELAREAVRPLPALIAAMTGNPAIARAVGPGGFLGLGGIAYVLARMAHLDPKSGLDECLTATIELAAQCADDGQADLTFGYAGGLAAMLAIHEQSGIPAAFQTARIFAGRLVALPELTAPGFATGRAGIAFALARFASDAGPQPAHAISLSVADDANHAWCTGLSGTLIARAARARHAGDSREHDEIARGVATLARQRPPTRDMSLCHGELGVLDTLAILAGTYNYRESEAALQQYTARLYALLNTFGPRCGTPNEVVSPGLLTGLAGIGYGLLRIAFPQQVPSVLAFESSRTVN